MKTFQPMFFTSIRNYSKEQFVKDLVAGIIVAIIALPLSIALALASGVGPEEGLYTAIVAGFLISFLGRDPGNRELRSRLWRSISLRCTGRGTTS